MSAEPYKGSMTESVEYVDKVVTAPTNASYLYLNVNKSYSSRYSVKLAEISSINDERLSILDTVDGNPFSMSGTAVLKDGCESTEYSEPIKATPFISITGKDDIELVGVWNTESGFSGLVFYDKYKNFISSVWESANIQKNIYVI